VSKFVIVSTARSGSTVLCRTLDQHTRIDCHGELFGQNAVRTRSVNTPRDVRAQLDVEQRNADPAGFLAAHTDDMPGEAVGFKLLLSQLDADFVHHPSVVRSIPYDIDTVIDTLAREAYEIVFLWRRDLVARLDSEIRFRIGRGLPDDAFDRLTTDLCLADFDMQRVSALRVLARLREAGCREPVPFDYEDLVAEPDRIGALYDAMGASDDGTRIPVKSVSGERPEPSVHDQLSASQVAAYSNAPSPLATAR